MFFTLSKILGFVAMPSNLLILLALAGLLLVIFGWRRTGVGLMSVSIVVLAIAGFSPLANISMMMLEERFPAWDATRGAPDGIIILGGAISPDVSADRGTPQVTEAAERILVTAELARRYPSARLVYSGGSGALSGGAIEADYALRQFEALGIERDRVLLERRSRNTAENAVFTKELVQPRPGERWLLVTSAAHMPRSVGSFRQVGFPVEAYPVDWRTRGAADRSSLILSLSGGLARLDAAAHEWIGLAAYWLTGRIPTLLPGPATD